MVLLVFCCCRSNSINSYISAATITMVRPDADCVPMMSDVRFFRLLRSFESDSHLLELGLVTEYSPRVTENPAQQPFCRPCRLRLTNLVPILRRPNSFTMVPPQVEKAVTYVDEFMAKYPTFTQYGTLSFKPSRSIDRLTVQGIRHQSFSR